MHKQEDKSCLEPPFLCLFIQKYEFFMCVCFYLDMTGLYFVAGQEFEIIPFNLMFYFVQKMKLFLTDLSKINILTTVKYLTCYIVPLADLSFIAKSSSVKALS